MRTLGDALAGHAAFALELQPVHPDAPDDAEDGSDAHEQRGDVEDVLGARRRRQDAPQHRKGAEQAGSNPLMPVARANHVHRAVQVQAPRRREPHTDAHRRKNGHVHCKLRYRCWFGSRIYPYTGKHKYDYQTL